MSSDVLHEELRRVPFTPVTSILPSGRTLTISNPGLTMSRETGRTLVIAQGEIFIHVDVATVEAIKTMVD